MDTMPTKCSPITGEHKLPAKAQLFTHIRDHPDSVTRVNSLKRVQDFIKIRTDPGTAAAAIAIIRTPKLDDVGILNALRARICPPNGEKRREPDEPKPSFDEKQREPDEKQRKPDEKQRKPDENKESSNPAPSNGAPKATSPPNGGFKKLDLQLAPPSSFRSRKKRPPTKTTHAEEPPVKTPSPPAKTPSPPCCGERAATGGGREQSRLRDVERELGIIAKAAGFKDYSYLDIGSAEGRITSAMAQALRLPRERAHACDIIPQPPLDTVTFTQCGPAKLPYPDASFDLITMFMAAHHFSDAAAMFTEARRVSKNNTLLLIREHDCQSEAALLYYDVIHALYACVFGAEATPEQFINQYSAGGFSFYRTQIAWITLARAHGFELHPDAGPHGPVVRGAYASDRYDSFYALFRLRGGPAERACES
jgi:SAM-dependent methyltransferase